MTYKKLYYVREENEKLVYIVLNNRTGDIMRLSPEEYYPLITKGESIG
ncbi:hypothetical protein [Virgibacillus sp. CBA3643]